MSSISRPQTKTGVTEADTWDVAPRIEYLCCKRKELQTWFYPEYLVCGNPNCQRKVKGVMIAEPRQSTISLSKATR